jgi:hypothetical protein
MPAAPLSPLVEIALLMPGRQNRSSLESPPARAYSHKEQLYREAVVFAEAGPPADAVFLSPLAT